MAPMKIDLRRGWELDYREHRSLRADVPCSLYSVMLSQGLMEDPFHGMNEKKALEMMAGGCVFRKRFAHPDGIPDGSRIELVFESIDTVSEVVLNGERLARTANMHRRWAFDVTDQLVAGENVLEVRIEDPVAWCAKADDEYPLFGMDFVCRGYQHLRKAHSMFGWDWGPQLPDMGIPGDVSLYSFEAGRLKDVRFEQVHTEGVVEVVVSSTMDTFLEGVFDWQVRIDAPDGRSFTGRAAVGRPIRIRIDAPRLWWPNGYGEPALHVVETTLRLDGRTVDRDERRIGLRTLTVSTVKDEWGREFCFVVNGEKIFAMGADYIPEDNLLPRVTPGRTERLIQDCVSANFNCIRVWGGGYYPTEGFYDLCDRYGLVVWQDFMFACATYRMDREFTAEITAEITDVLVRIRHHASLGLLCGNNEMEAGIIEWVKHPNERIKQDYLFQYEKLIPELCKDLAPGIFYWPASPSSGGGFERTNDFDWGDTHFWDVWHKSKPFETYRDHHFRFCSEFGFEAFPDLETLRSFCPDEEMNPFSETMESHQKCPGGNAKILQYLSQYYRMPVGMDRFVYASQVLQADAIRYGVEHMRRNRGRCMGAVYWQLNDCWPGPSWSGIDSFGRYKALQYSARRFFAPVLLSVCDAGKKMVLNVSNERREAVSGVIEYGVSDADLRTVFRETLPFSLPPLSALDVGTVDVAAHVGSRGNRRFFWYRILSGDGGPTPASVILFVKPKHFVFHEPDIRTSIETEGTGFRLTLASKAFAKGVRLDFEGFDADLSDNYFDLCGQDVSIHVEPRVAGITKERLAKALRFLSVYDLDGKGTHR